MFLDAVKQALRVFERLKKHSTKSGSGSRTSTKEVGGLWHSQSRAQMVSFLFV